MVNGRIAPAACARLRNAWLSARRGLRVNWRRSSTRRRLAAALWAGGPAAHAGASVPHASAHAASARAGSCRRRCLDPSESRIPAVLHRRARLHFGRRQGASDCSRNGHPFSRASLRFSPGSCVPEPDFSLWDEEDPPSDGCPPCRRSFTFGLRAAGALFPRGTERAARVGRGRSNHQGGGLVSLRSSLWRYLGLLAVAALAVGVFAGPASAKKMSAKQRVAVRAQLRKQIKKNPAVINRKSFVKRASLVNFKLPVTLRLRGATTNANPNKATVDLGASLGQREIDLGGNLAAEITFHDSFDGGALGNVDLDILPSTTKSLTSTSIPLLWNTQVTQPGTRYDANTLGLPAAASGCSNWVGSSNLPFGSGLGPGPAP